MLDGSEDVSFPENVRPQSFTTIAHPYSTKLSRFI